MDESRIAIGLLAGFAFFWAELWRRHLWREPSLERIRRGADWQLWIFAGVFVALCLVSDAVRPADATSVILGHSLGYLSLRLRIEQVWERFRPGS